MNLKLAKMFRKKVTQSGYIVFILLETFILGVNDIFYLHFQKAFLTMIESDF